MPYFDGVPNEDVWQCRDCKAVFTNEHCLPIDDDVNKDAKGLCPKCTGLMQPAFYRPGKDNEPA